MPSAPDAVVTLSGGEDVRLSELWSERPLVLSFLRHSGCLFCREHVLDMNEAADLNILFVSLNDLEEVTALKQGLNSPHRFASDPDRVVYERYSVESGPLTRVLSLRMVGRGMAAMRKGATQKQPTADVRQMPGVVVISPQGDIVWRHEARHAGDNPSLAQIREAVSLAVAGGHKDE